MEAGQVAGGGDGHEHLHEFFAINGDLEAEGFENHHGERVDIRPGVGFFGASLPDFGCDVGRGAGEHLVGGDGGQVLCFCQSEVHDS